MFTLGHAAFVAARGVFWITNNCSYHGNGKAVEESGLVSSKLQS